MSSYTKKELFKLFERLPAELKEALLAEDTADTIHNIARRYGIEKQVSALAERVGRVLLGILPPEQLPDVLEQEMKIEKEKAQKIALEVNRFILYPVKTSLGEIYKGVQLAPSGRIAKDKIPETKEETKPSLEESQKQKEEKRKDIYREPIE